MFQNCTISTRLEEASKMEHHSFFQGRTVVYLTYQWDRVWQHGRLLNHCLISLKNSRSHGEEIEFCLEDKELKKRFCVLISKKHDEKSNALGSDTFTLLLLAQPQTLRQFGPLTEVCRSIKVRGIIPSACCDCGDLREACWHRSQCKPGQVLYVSGGKSWVTVVFHPPPTKEPLLFSSFSCCCFMSLLPQFLKSGWVLQRHQQLSGSVNMHGHSSPCIKFQCLTIKEATVPQITTWYLLYINSLLQIRLNLPSC
jgi:hypothetical protein